MIFDRQGSTTVITKESVSLKTFVDRLIDSYDKIKQENLIINLFSLHKITLSDLLLFLEISNRHRQQKKSFVIVTDKLNYREVPDELVVVPTMQEAYDVIAIEDMERDMEF